MTTATKTTLATAVEVRIDGGGTWIVHEMPVKVVKRHDLTGLVFYYLDGASTVTILLSDGDRRDLIKMLGGRLR